MYYDFSRQAIMITWMDGPLYFLFYQAPVCIVGLTLVGLAIVGYTLRRESHQ